MDTTYLTKFWPVIHSAIQEFLAIIEPQIEDAAIQANTPMELYYYSEFGLESFSRKEFQKRDPFSNPLLFEKAFVNLNFRGWIEPQTDEKYRVTERAREAVRTIIRVGYEQLLPFESFADLDLSRLAILLKQISMANEFAPEPPEKWAILKRFRVADKNSPAIVQVREYLMDLFAYRDDCHFAATHPHFGRAGIIWVVLGALCNANTVDAAGLAETLSFRGYEASHYEVALQAAVQIGWAEQSESPDSFRISEKGRAVHDQAGQLMNESFYAPWSAMTTAELDELYDLLVKLKEQLNSYRKIK